MALQEQYKRTSALVLSINNRTLVFGCLLVTVIFVLIYQVPDPQQFQPQRRFHQVNFVANTQIETTKWIDLENYWFLPNGNIYPEPNKRDAQTKKRSAKLYPEESASDRIIDQLMFVPPDYNPETAPIKKIFVANQLKSWDDLTIGSEIFKNCPVNACTISNEIDKASEMDAILFKKSQYDDISVRLSKSRSPKQVWILYFLESPYHAPRITFDWSFNWTATYRDDSDIVTPYNRWIFYNNEIKQLPQNERNFAQKKTRKVAWLVSNCHPQNERMTYALELKKYIDVDIFGKCGSMKCPQEENCLDFLSRNYKFYLSFENSNCKSYVTEKLFSNAINKTIIPIVMGARREDYERYVPQKSFIYVEDFNSPKDLANYLHFLDRDDTLYNSFFQWKGTGVLFANLRTFLGCRICALLHDDSPLTKTYDSILKWWNGEKVCSRRLWKFQ